MRQTKDLGNIFQLVAGFRKDNRTTEEIQYYTAEAAILSIKDYNDEAKVNQCLTQGCQYVLNLLLRVTANSRTLEVSSIYFGGVGLNQLIVIDKVKIYYDDIQI